MDYLHNTVFTDRNIPQSFFMYDQSQQWTKELSLATLDYFTDETAFYIFMNDLVCLLISCTAYKTIGILTQNPSNYCCIPLKF